MLTILALAAGVLVQAGAPAAQPPAAGTAIFLDFLALGADGRSVTDLTPPNITLKIDGKVRPLQSLDLVPAEGSRTILLVVDEATLFGLEQVAKDAIARLLTSLSPGDRIAYISTRRGRVTALTANHQSVTDAASAMLAGPGVLWTCLTDMVTSLGSLTRTAPTGRATSLIVLSRGSPYDGTFGSESGGGCSPRSSTMRQLNETVSAAQINVHLLTVDHTNRSWGLDSLARNIGAGTGLLTWSDAGDLERAVSTAARFYRATFPVDPAANDRLQRVELRLDRPAVKIQTSSRIRIDRAAVLGKTR